MSGINRYNNTLKRPKVETDLDIILEHMMDMTGTVKLDDKLQKMHDRIEFAYEQIRGRYQDADIVSLISKRFQVSRSTAYNDIRNARYLFGSMGPVNLVFEIRELLQLSIFNIRMAIESKNVKDFTKAIEARTNILKLHKERDDVDWSKLEPSHYYLVINNPAGDSFRLDLDTLDKIPATETKEIISQINSHFDEETIDIIAKDVTDPNQAASTQQGTGDTGTTEG